MKMFPICAALMCLCAVSDSPAQGTTVQPAAAEGQAVETFLAEGDGLTLHLRIGSGRRVELFAPSTGGHLSGAGLIDNRGAVGGFTGVLANGVAFGVVGHGIDRSLWIGERTFTLRSMAAAQFGVGAPAPSAPQARTPAAQHGGASLAGLRLHTAKSGNGYSTERTYDLCADGRVFTRWAELQLSQFGSGTNEAADQGRWHQSGTTLQLALQRGGSKTLHVVQAEPGVVRLDDVSYSAQPSSRCR